MLDQIVNNLICERKKVRCRTSYMWQIYTEELPQNIYEGIFLLTVSLVSAINIVEKQIPVSKNLFKVSKVTSEQCVMNVVLMLFFLTLNRFLSTWGREVPI